MANKAAAKKVKKPVKKALKKPKKLPLNKKQLKREIRLKVRETKGWLSKSLGVPMGGKIDDILKHRIKTGVKELARVKKAAVKKFDPRVIKEFERMALKKAKKLKVPSTKIMEAKLQIKERIMDNIKKLFHLMRASKKKKEIVINFKK